MDNSSDGIVFVLQGVNDTRTNRQIYFALALLTYLLTIFVNLMLITTIFLDKTLHEPMYFFICNLCVNEMLGASGFYPKLLVDLLSEFHVISYTWCLIQVSVIYNYILCEFTNLTVMAYDRYVAICKPLQYQSIITPQRVRRLVLLIWLVCILEVSVGTILTSILPICGYEIDGLYCSNVAVVKLACTDTTLNRSYGYITIISYVSQGVFIVISYIYIIRASLRSKAEQAKFMQTCLPHLITFINFTISLTFDVMYVLLGYSNTHVVLRNILAVQFLILPPLLNPVIYGIKLARIRVSLMKIWNLKLRALT
ncbi:olfactory receptor 1D2-like [Chanos chanos]|uniref:Olfactory receptor n=1 Tax=Chanos chanos TaxID=29144 RepID=A0A6J2VNG8_CHACN|nr:olfactory receptor 1D2-like [Chanos chanos]